MSSLDAADCLDNDLKSMSLHVSHVKLAALTTADGREILSPPPSASLSSDSGGRDLIDILQ